MGKREIIEWPVEGNGKYWVVEVTGKDGSWTPLYEGKGNTRTARREDCLRWLSRNREAK